VEAVKQHGKVTLSSRRGNVLNNKFPYIATALKELPDETILGGELVALDAKGRSVLNLLQNFRSAEAQIHYDAFDILALKGKDLTQHCRECPGKVPNTSSLRDQSFPRFPRHSPELRISGVEADRDSHSKYSGGSVPNAAELDLPFGTDAFEVVVLLRITRRGEAFPAE